MDSTRKRWDLSRAHDTMTKKKAVCCKDVPKKGVANRAKVARHTATKG